MKETTTPAQNAPSAANANSDIEDQDTRKAMKTSDYYKTESLPTRFEYPG
jgi:hypothetical protein